jgi:O-Antigen ligase
MTLEYVGVVALLIGMLGLFREPPFIVYFFFCSTLLGSAAAFVLDALGGTNISPAHLLLGFLTLRLVSDSRLTEKFVQEISFGRPGFWLFLTVVYSVIGAFCLPRLLAGDTSIFAVRAETPFTIPLSPSMANLTQSIYFIADLVCFVVLGAYASTIGGARTLASAALACAALNLIFGALDLITYFTNTTELFAPIRNANYALLDEAEVAGLKRIVGSFTEASSFAAATLIYFAFTSRLWLLGVKPRVTFPLAFLSLCAVVLSTSTTGYVGLAVLLCYIYLQALLPALYRPVTIQARNFILAAPFVLALLVVIIALSPEYTTYVHNFLEGTIFNKMSTASGVERSSWNNQALQNFLDTFGFGVGNGSARASSFPIAVLANLGLAGALMFGMFFVTLFLSGRGNGQSDPLDDAYRQAAKMACLAGLVTASISGALVDLGLPFYIFAGLCSAQQSPMPAVQPYALSEDPV